MSKLTDEELAVIDRIAAFELGRPSAMRVRAALNELRELRALLATPFVDAHVGPPVIKPAEDEPALLRVWWRCEEHDPDKAIALGAALIRAALAARTATARRER